MILLADASGNPCDPIGWCQVVHAHVGLDVGEGSTEWTDWTEVEWQTEWQVVSAAQGISQWVSEVASECCQSECCQSEAIAGSSLLHSEEWLRGSSGHCTGWGVRSDDSHSWTLDSKEKPGAGHALHWGGSLEGIMNHDYRGQIDNIHMLIKYSRIGVILISLGMTIYSPGVLCNFLNPKLVMWNWIPFV